MDLQKNCEIFFFSSRRRHTRYIDDWSSDVCSSDLDRHVHDDPINPGVKRRTSPKTLNRFPRFEEAVLSKVPGVLLAMNHVVNHAKYSCSVASYQLVECLGVTSLASCHQVQVRHIGLSQSRFRLHELDGSGPCFIQPRKLSGPNRRRHSPRYSPIRVTMPSRT